MLPTLAGLGPSTQAKEEHTQVCLILCWLTPNHQSLAPAPLGCVHHCPSALSPVSLRQMMTAGF